MSHRLQNKVAIVTGGGQGIGQATCELFAEEGAQVIVADLSRQDGETTASAIKARGFAAEFVHCDISREEDARHLIEQCVVTFGGVDVLVNNAATFVLKGLEATVEDWQRSLGVNIIGTALVSRYAVEAMKPRGGGTIVNLGSMSGFIAQPQFTTYSATKAALIQMTKNMAMDLAPFNIRVNAVCPGTILTRASRDHMEQTGMTLAEFEAEEGPKHLLNRIGHPREVAYAILFLACNESSFVTGTHLLVDGGYTVQ